MACPRDTKSSLLSLFESLPSDGVRCLRPSRPLNSTSRVCRNRAHIFRALVGHGMSFIDSLLRLLTILFLVDSLVFRWPPMPSPPPLASPRNPTGGHMCVSIISVRNNTAISSPLPSLVGLHRPRLLWLLSSLPYAPDDKALSNSSKNGGENEYTGESESFPHSPTPLSPGM